MASSSATSPQGQKDIDSFQPVHKPPGYAMLVVNTNPKGDSGKFEFKIREGANEDSANLQLVFIEKLGFKWLNQDCHEDVTTLQWDHRKGKQLAPGPEGDCQCLRCRIIYTDHTDSKYFVLAISSHGREITETEIIFSDGNSIHLSEIFEALNDVNCPTLKGKPRIIILQVCRAMYKDNDKVKAMQDKGALLPIDNPSSEQSSENLAVNIRTQDEDDPSLGRFNVDSVEDHTLQQLALSKMPEQYLLIYPVVSGQKAKRNTDDGSWLLHGMKKIFLERYDSVAKPVNFLQFITAVSGHVARERESFKTKPKDTGSNDGSGDQNQQSKDDTSGTTPQNESGNRKKRERKSNKDWEKDEENSGFKNAVCFHHKLLTPIIFYPKEYEPDLPVVPNFKV